MQEQALAGVAQDRPRRRRARPAPPHPGRSRVGRGGQAGRLQAGRQRLGGARVRRSCSAISPRAGSRASRARAATASSPSSAAIVSIASSAARAVEACRTGGEARGQRVLLGVAERRTTRARGSRLRRSRSVELAGVVRVGEERQARDSGPRRASRRNSGPPARLDDPALGARARTGDVELVEQRPDARRRSRGCADRVDPPGSQAARPGSWASCGTRTWLSRPARSPGPC